jgi:hypothetical protein
LSGIDEHEAKNKKFEARDGRGNTLGVGNGWWIKGEHRVKNGMRKIDM